MTKQEKNFVLACVLGDGCINKRIINNTPQCRFLLKHSLKQKEYFLWKVEKLSEILSRKSIKDSTWKIEKECGRSKLDAVRFERNHPYLKSLYSFIYQSNKKTFSKKVLDRLSIEGIAIWYMDDGSLYNVKYANTETTYRFRTAQCTLNTYLSEKENEVIVDWFKKKHNIIWRIVKDKGFTRLQMGTQEARKFIALIKDFIHPTMMYKTNIRVGEVIDRNTLQPIG